MSFVFSTITTITSSLSNSSITMADNNQGSSSNKGGEKPSKKGGEKPSQKGEENSTKKVAAKPAKELVVGRKRRNDEDQGSSGPASKAARTIMIPRNDAEIMWNKGMPAGLIDTVNPDNKNFVIGRPNSLVGQAQTRANVNEGLNFWVEQNNGVFPDTTYAFVKTKRGADTRRREISEKLNPKMYNHAHLAESSDEEDEAASADKTDKDGDAHMGGGSENPTSSKGKGKEKAEEKAEEKKEEKKEQKKGAKKGEKKGSAKPCPNCKKMGHVLRHCAGPPSDDGYMHGCPVHNTMSHTYDECNTVKDTFRVNDHCHMLIMCRAGLPPIFTKIDWMEIAVNSTEQRSYPLTAEESIYTLEESYEDFDYSPVAEFPQLLMNSKTATWTTIRENWDILTESPIGQAAPKAVTAAAPADDDGLEDNMEIDDEEEVVEKAVEEAEKPTTPTPNFPAFGQNPVRESVEEDEDASSIRSGSTGVLSDGENQLKLASKKYRY